ncbi:MAG: GTPase domain-containing protein [Hyphomonadaceae bacterium]|nr:GTPase domain-containing protein [Hyphomonadaceae bacterium]
MNDKRKDLSYSRAVLLGIALLLPTASLIPLGGLWLWQQGYVVYWAIATCFVVAGLYYVQARIVAGPAPAGLAQSLDEGAQSADEQAWTPRQAEAWNDVKALAASVDAQRMASRDAALNLGLETIETVARRLHPERSDPLLQFTVPEALAVVERASNGMREFITTTFPFGDRITVAQLMWLYRWRGALNLAEKGYDLWRIVRLLNPLSAASQELRERFTREIYDMGREHLGRRLARAYVKEVGRAAIDLYGGALRVTPTKLQGHVTAASREDMAAAAGREAEPIRILLAGQTGAGKSTLLNALANAVEAEVDAMPATTRPTAYKLTHEGMPAALLIDSPGLTDAGSLGALIESAARADMVLWVSSATRAARETDRQALAAIRNHFAAAPNRRRPPMLLVLTHIDGLRPFREWEPPYDLTAGTRAKSQSILGAMQAAGSELGFASGEIVPVRVDIAVAPYNIDALWGKIIELAPEAQRARLLRTLSDIVDASSWATVWSQAANAGRVIKDTFLSRNGHPESEGTSSPKAEQAQQGNSSVGGKQD